MKISKLALAVALAAVWTGVPSIPRAENQDGGKVGEGEKRGKRGDKDRREQDLAMRGKMLDLERKAREAARKMSKGSDVEKTAAKTEAKKLLGDLFDAKLAREENRLARIEKQAAGLKERIAKQKADREKMIENRLARLSGGGDDGD